MQLGKAVFSVVLLVFGFAGLGILSGFGFGVYFSLWFVVGVFAGLFFGFVFCWIWWIAAIGCVFDGCGMVFWVEGLRWFLCLCRSFGFKWFSFCFDFE